jgi:hypothetical protein
MICSNPTATRIKKKGRIPEVRGLWMGSTERGPGSHKRKTLMSKNK